MLITAARTDRRKHTGAALCDCLAALLLSSLVLTTAISQCSYVVRSFARADRVLRRQTTLIDWRAKEITNCTAHQTFSAYRHLTCRKPRHKERLHLLVPE